MGGRRTGHWALTALAPAWLVEVVRPKPTRPPWGRMVLAAVAVTAPVALGVLVGDIVLGILPAIGAISAVGADQADTYRSRMVRLAAVAAGGATGFVIGGDIRGDGLWTVVVVTLVAVVSALLSAAGGTGSVASLNLLVMTVIATGMPLAGAPWKHGLLFLAGTAWTALLIGVVWPFRPTAPERAAVAAVYRALAAFLRDPTPAKSAAYGTVRRSAYRQILAARSRAHGAQQERTRLIALLNQAYAVRDAAVSLGLEEIESSPDAAAYTERIAHAVVSEVPVPEEPPVAPTSPARRALRTALTGAAELVDPAHLIDEPRSFTGARRRPSLRTFLAEVTSGRLIRVYTVRLALCMAVAATLSEVNALDRSYWVMLTVAVVLKPDFGSVFARALQRGLGTVVGAVAGATLLALTKGGAWLLAPIAALSFALPYGKQRNWGLFSTFQAPLVILLIDLPSHTGWRLAETRLVDTVVGCVIVLTLGYLPWPTSWSAPVPPRLADAMEAVAAYLRRAFDPRVADALAGPSTPKLRQRAYDRTADLRASFQRALAEPPSVSRRVTAWWPTIVAVQRTLDVIAATVARTRNGGAPPPTPGAVDKLADALTAMAADIRDGTHLRPVDLPLDDPLAPVTVAVAGIRDAFTGGRDPHAAGGAE